MSQLFASGGQSIGVSASALLLPMNIQDLFPLGWTAFFKVQLSHSYMTTGKTIALTRQTFVGKVMSLFFNMLSRLVIVFLPRSKCLNFMVAVTICSDFGAPHNSLSLCPLFPHLFAIK